MKIIFPYNTFPGGFQRSIMKSLEILGHKTIMLQKFSAPITNKIFRFSKFEPFVKYGILKRDKLYNKFILEQFEEIKPDVFINYSGSNFFPETLRVIKEKFKCLMICYIADNPCDPDPRRDKYFPMTLKYYDIFLNPEPIWDKLIHNLVDNPKIIRYYGGYDPELFYPAPEEDITENDYKNFCCDVSFTGGSYRQSAEGGYRSEILLHLSKHFNVKLWGDIGWKQRFLFQPELKKIYQGERLSYEDLRKLYKISNINLNLPSPQIFTSFQPRVFEISASMGFQIIDHSNELYNIFPKDLVITFKSIQDLKDKIYYFLKNDNERKEISLKMYEIVKENYTWMRSINFVLKEIGLI